MNRHQLRARLIWWAMFFATICSASSALEAQQWGEKEIQSAVNTLLGQRFQEPASALQNSRAVRSCDSLRQATLPVRATVEAQAKDRNGVPWCSIKLEIQRQGSPNTITVWIGLPSDHWNGRFLGLGGGGFGAGVPSLIEPVAKRGFAVAVTDGGHRLDPEDPLKYIWDASWVLDSHGRLDWRAVRDFGYDGIHLMTLSAKAVVTEYYGIAPRYSYFSGCSTGGRQGQAEVQRFPTDYDGVLSAAPAINGSRGLAGGPWLQLLAREFGPVAQCKIVAAHAAVMQACDGLDGAQDGIIAAPRQCRFDASSLIGVKTACGTISAQDAEVMRRVWKGPHTRSGEWIYDGLAYGAELNLSFDPPPPSQRQILGYFVAQDPSWTGEGMTADAFEDIYRQLTEEFGVVLDSNWADISGFMRAGGKTIIWHGLADPYIPAEGTRRYVDSIRNRLGHHAADEVLRYYEVPGVEHCGHGVGAPPVRMLNTLIDWVEHDRAPNSIVAQLINESGGVDRTRLLCPYPQYARFSGHGSVNDASNYACRK